MQLTNTLGGTPFTIKESIITANPQVTVCDFNWWTRNPMETSIANDCHLTVIHAADFELNTKEYPFTTLAGSTQIMTVTKLMKYTNIPKSKTTYSTPTPNNIPNRFPRRILGYKTKPCRNFDHLNNNCKFGESCDFAHGEEDLHQRTHIKPVSSRSQRALPNSSTPVQPHALNQSEPVLPKPPAGTLPQHVEDLSGQSTEQQESNEYLELTRQPTSLSSVVEEMLAKQHRLAQNTPKKPIVDLLQPVNAEQQESTAEQQEYTAGFPQQEMHAPDPQSSHNYDPPQPSAGTFSQHDAGLLQRATAEQKESTEQPLSTELPKSLLPIGEEMLHNQFTLAQRALPNSSTPVQPHALNQSEPHDPPKPPASTPSQPVEENTTTNASDNFPAQSTTNDFSISQDTTTNVLIDITTPPISLIIMDTSLSTPSKKYANPSKKSILNSTLESESSTPRTMLRAVALLQPGETTTPIARKGNGDVPKPSAKKRILSPQEESSNKYVHLSLASPTHSTENPSKPKAVNSTINPLSSPTSPTGNQITKANNNITKRKEGWFISTSKKNNNNQ